MAGFLDIFRPGGEINNGRPIGAPVGQIANKIGGAANAAASSLAPLASRFSGILKPGEEVGVNGSPPRTAGIGLPAQPAQPKGVGLPAKSDPTPAPAAPVAGLPSIQSPAPAVAPRAAVPVTPTANVSVSSPGQPTQRIPTAQAPVSATSAPTTAPAASGHPMDPYERSMWANYQDAQSSFRGGNQAAWDTHRNHLAGLAAQAQAYHLGGARALGADPYTKVGVIDKINEKPARVATAVALGGGDPVAGTHAEEVAARGDAGHVPFDPTNWQSAGMASPDTAGAAGMLAGDLPFHEKVAALAAMPGASDPGSRVRSLFDAFMASRNAKGQDFANEMAQYNPGGNIAYDLSNPVGTLGQIFGAAKTGIFGEDPAIAARNRQLHNDMGRMGYAPASIGVPPAGY